MKISLNKLIAIVIAVVVVVTITIGVIIATKSKVAKKEIESNKASTSEDTKNTGKIKYTGSFGGNEKIGTEEEFEIILDESILPEDIEKNETECVVDGITWYYYLDSKGNANYLSTYDNSLQGDIIIPEELDGHKTLSIGKRPSAKYSTNTLFRCSEKDRKGITSVTVPEGVIYVGAGSFYGLENLERVTLPDSITYIGDEAFKSSDNLKYINSNIEGKIVMPKGLQYYGKDLFEYNKKINDFEFPEQINYIQHGTFNSATGFTELEISEQYKYIGEYAFAESYEIEDLKICDGVKIIDDGAFSLCKGIKNLEIGSTVTTIGDGAFQRCNLIENFKYDGKLKYFGSNISAPKILDFIKEEQLP